MGRPKGSRNGIRRVAIKYPKYHELHGKCFQYIYVNKNIYSNQNERNDDLNEINEESQLPIFDSAVLRAYRADNFEKCIKLIEKILDNNNDEYKNHYKILQAASYTMLGKDLDKSHEILDEVLKEEPFNTSAYYGKGFAFYLSNKYEQSVKMLQKAIEIDPSENMDKARNLMMRIDVNQRKLVVKVKKMEEDKSLTLNSHDPFGMKSIIDAFNKNFNKNHCIDLKNIRENSKFGEDDIEKMKVNCFKDKEMDSIKNVWNNDKGNNTLEDVEMKESCNEQVDTENPPSITDIPECLPKSFVPKSAEDFFKKGMELYISGVLDKSVKMFEKATELDPKMAEAEEMEVKAQSLIDLIDIAHFNMTKKKYETVADILNQALEIDHTNDYINRLFYFQRGLAFYNLGEREKAWNDYEKYDELSKNLL
ncbi:CLUMA_CG015283, isoform A [Clunio marinus]|uniref:CLUMA_CG015283, isoform A n=1 Tax=Clunio marinus TaxID=568069 RepID=A0A1J1IPR5_9DIPT|nr:CLUMA_CG015283, isoform A [Clunio marinus]